MKWGYFLFGVFVVLSAFSQFLDRLTEYFKGSLGMIDLVFNIFLHLAFVIMGVFSIREAFKKDKKQ